MSLSDDMQADIIDAFDTTSRYLDDILNIDNVYFDNMVSFILSHDVMFGNDTTTCIIGSFPLSTLPNCI